MAAAAYEPDTFEEFPRFCRWRDLCLSIGFGSHTMGRMRHCDRRSLQQRIRNLNRRAEEINGGPVMSWTSNAMPPDLQEAFWRQLIAHEEGPFTTDFQKLLDAGVELPEPDTLDDVHLKKKLWEVIRALARLRVFLSSTDHLSDRELYTLLWHELLREEVPVLPVDERTAWHVDPLLTGAEWRTCQYLKHYADEEYRQKWQRDFPDYVMPAHEDPPYDRDRHLPKPQH